MNDQNDKSISEAGPLDYDLTLCICVRNGEKYIERCFTAIERQIANTDIKVIVVNHRSTDGTLDLLTTWISKRQSPFKVIYLDHGGLADARNLAWRQASTKWVAFIDVDCEIQPGWLESVRQGIVAYESNKAIAAFGGNNVIPVEQGILYRAYRLVLTHYIGGHNSSLNRVIPKAMSTVHLPTLNIVYRTSILKEVGGFDPSYTRVAEDLDLSFRIRERGYQLWIQPKMIVNHAVKGNIKSWAQNMFLYGKGRILFSIRHPASFEVKFLAPLAVVLTYLLTVGLDVKNWNFPKLTFCLFALHFFSVFVLLGPNVFRTRETLKVWTLAACTTLLTHMAYGLGMLDQLIFTKGLRK